jgi:hypothetical protein
LLVVVAVVEATAVAVALVDLEHLLHSHWVHPLQ